MSQRLFVDLTHKLTPDTQVYPGDPPFTCHYFASIKRDGYNAHTLSMSSHTGTHIDAPYHFFDDGKTIDQIPLSMLVGAALVVDLTQKLPKERITWDDLASFEHQMKDGTILLLRTGWSDHWDTQKFYDHPFLERSAAEHIMNTGVRVVGLDTLSPDETHVEPPADGEKGDFGAHQVILGAGGVIVENLTNLGKLTSGEFIVSIAPLSIAGCDGSPVRAFAWRDGDI
jgi:kynurenine formamidase